MKEYVVLMKPHGDEEDFDRRYQDMAHVVAEWMDDKSVFVTKNRYGEHGVWMTREAFIKSVDEGSEALGLPQAFYHGAGCGAIMNDRQIEGIN